MIVVLSLVGWTLCSIIVYGVLRAAYPDEIYGDETLAMFICFVAWPLHVLIGIGWLIFHQLSKLGEWLGGFFVGFLGGTKND